VNSLLKNSNTTPNGLTFEPTHNLKMKPFLWEYEVEFEPELIDINRGEYSYKHEIQAGYL
jgi:hypothetical protein